MRAKDASQFSIEGKTKNRFDKYKALNKEQIIEKYRLEKRLVTNSQVIDYLLDNADEWSPLRAVKKK